MCLAFRATGEGAAAGVVASAATALVPGSAVRNHAIGTGLAAAFLVPGALGGSRLALLAAGVGTVD